MTSWLQQSFHRLRSFFRRAELDRDLDAEISAHLQLAAEENLQRGLSPDEAHRQALLRFGGAAQAKEQHRDARSLPFLETLLQDLRFAFRMLRKSPGFTTVAVLTLALGIGANTAIFSLVNGILLVPLPYPQPEKLVSITGTYPKGGVVAMREQMRTTDVAAYYEGHEFNLTGQGEPLRLTGTVVSAEFFSVLGARPELGRARPGQLRRPRSCALATALRERSRNHRPPDSIGRHQPPGCRRDAAQFSLPIFKNANLGSAAQRPTKCDSLLGR